MDEYQSELLNFLKKDFKDLNVVVMPDFFMDRLVSLEYAPSDFTFLLADKVQRKGGSIDQILQIDQLGGNAINIASALASFGAKVIPIVCANKFGFKQIRHHFDKQPVDLSHVKIVDKPSITTALEFQVATGKANVMLRDVGDLADFGPASLDESDYEAIANADYVCLFNWVGTRRFGTQLAQNVFSYTKTKGKGKTYYDTADPNPAKEKVSELIELVLKSSDIDILSLNENEAFSFASTINNDFVAQKLKFSLSALALESARILAKHLQARIDLHTTTFSATISTKCEVIIPAFRVEVLRATGAGDAWDAGNIIGDANALSDEARLALANGISAYYISNPIGGHPSKLQLMEFIQRTKVWVE